MVPAFNPKITDYAVRCTTRSTTHLLTQGMGPVTVGGKTYTSAAQPQHSVGGQPGRFR